MLRKIACLILLFLSTPLFAAEIKIHEKDLAFAPLRNPNIELLQVTELSSFDARFGGLSALLKHGDDFISVSDKGHLFTFKNAKFTHASISYLKDKNDFVLEGKKQTDSESLTPGPDGSVYISFERKHRVVPYNVEGYVLGKKVKLPKDLSLLSKNGGFEAISSLRDGRLVLLAEGKTDADETLLLVQKKKKGKWKKYKFPLTDGFRPTGLARLPDQDAFILMERFYALLRGVRIRLSLLNAKEGARGPLLAELGPPTPLDNFEGITAYKDEQDRTILMLISDDNFNPLQRTLLMKIVLH